MSKALVMITPSAYSLTAIASQLTNRQEVDKCKVTPGDIYVEKGTQEGSNYVSITPLTPAEMSREEYREWDELSDEFKVSLDECVFYMFTFNDMPFCNQIIAFILEGQQANGLAGFWFDNDYAEIIPAELALKNLQRDAVWNWRS